MPWLGGGCETSLRHREVEGKFIVGAGGGSEFSARSKKRGATHQDNQQSSSVGVGPGQDGSFGAATVARSWPAKQWRELGPAELGLGV